MLIVMDSIHCIALHNFWRWPVLQQKSWISGWQVVRMGAHPLHQRCLELYSCVASACRVCAGRGAGVAALRRAALYGLLQAAAVEAMLAVGEPHLAAERTASCLADHRLAQSAALQGMSITLE